MALSRWCPLVLFRSALQKLNEYLANLDFDTMIAHAEERYQTGLEDTFDDIDPEQIWQNLAQRGIVNGELVDPEALENDPFIQQVVADAEAAQEPTAPIPPQPKPKRERITFEPLYPEIPKEQRINFRITDLELGYGTASEKYAANTAAIRLLKRIEDEGRMATPAEQEILSRYVGSGGLADCLDEKHSKFQELKALLSEEEYAAARASYTTGADGTVTVSGLQKGTYYAKEIPKDDPYWAFDTSVKSVTVAVGQTTEVTFTNTHYGRIEIRKTTNTSNQLGGWTFRVKDSNGNTIGDFTTDDNGYACTGNLPLGRYTVVELPTEDNYWLTELGFHDVTVKAGETTVDNWLNKEQGLAWFYKKTNTGESVEGWHITVYSDEACTQKVGTLITNEDGRAGYYLDPGTYWAKETGDEHGRFEDEYWMVDETIHKFEIKPHEDVSITFTNVQYGRLKITKTVEGGGSVEGWQFKITDAEGTVLDGSPFATDEDGIILTGNLLPGKYTVEEILPENSFYQCVNENPQTVIVKQGEIAGVSFTNALRSGKITVDKIDTTGEHLAGATFLLEWSAEGSLWYPVKYLEGLAKGGCSNSALVDGTLTSGEDGILEWDNLYPGLHYRVTELKAPNGYELLKGYAFEGQLPADDLQISLQVMVVFGGTEILFPIHERDCVQHKMIMQMVCLIQMGGDYHLISFAPQASCQLNTNLVSDFWGGFSRSKGLVAVVGYGSVLLAKTLFHRHHFFPRCAGVAVDPGHKALEVIQFLINLLCLVAADSVRDNFIQVLTIPLRHIPVFIKFRVGCLVGILHIDHHLPQPAVDPPDGCDCHFLLLDGAWTYHSFGDFFHRCLKLCHSGIVPPDINDIQGVSFLGDLVQIITNTVKLLCHGIIVRGRRLLWNQIIDKMTKVSGNRDVAALGFLLQSFCFLFTEPYLNFDITITHSNKLLCSLN